MKKRILFTVLSAILLMGILVGCKSDVEDVSSSENVGIIEYETPYKICSLCEQEKICGSYDVNGEIHVVCDDCYNEFATAFSIPRTCSLCGEEKPCAGYMMEETLHVVCNECYPTFATELGIPTP